MRNAEAVALVAKILNQYVAGLEEDLIAAQDPESRKELALFIDEAYMWLSNLWELMPHTSKRSA